MSNNHINKHTMKKLAGRIISKKFMGFDVETVGSENTFYSGGFWWEDKHDRIRWRYFRDAQKMREFILRKKWRDYTIVATNLSFDFNCLFFNTEEWNDFKIIMRGSRIIMANYKLPSRNGNIKFIDTMNFIPFGVSKLGAILGIPKLDYPSFWLKDEDGNISAHPPSNKREMKELEMYNKQDCKISSLFMEFLQEGINKIGGKLQITSASTALDVFRRKFQPKDIIKEEYILQDEDIKDFIFKGYYGGRTEAFKRGKITNANYYDINSLYPSVMRFPYPEPSSVFKPQKLMVKHILYEEGVSECTVYCPYMRYPILPYRKNGKLMFPTGNFRGTWNNVELRKAIELGYEIREVHQQLCYAKVFYPFKEYVEELYSLRQEYKKEKSSYELVVKLLMNSLYGKFAQRYLQDYKVVDDNYLTDEQLKKIIEGNVEFDYIDDKIVIKEDKICNSVFTFPILSSYVTSYARIVMYRYIKEYDALYTDTDSIITKRSIPESDKLGKMKLEAKILNGIVVKPKLYLVSEGIKYKNGEEIKIEGKKAWVKAKGIKRPNKQDFMDIIRGIKVQKDKFTTLKESIRRHMLPNTIVEVEKKVNLEDDKRVWKNLFNPLELQDSEPVNLEEIEVLVTND